MAGREPKMKIGIGADTSDFEKGAKTVKKGLNDLSKTGTQAIGDLGNAFGVNTGKVEQMISSIRGLGAKMSEASNVGVAAFGKLLGSITPLGGAIAGLGLATAIAGFKQLKAEADNFKSTIDGMNMSMATAAYISTYKQVLHDVNSDTGKQVAEAMDKWERGFGRFKAQLGATFTTFMTSSTLGEFGESFKGLRQSFREAKTNAEEAAKLGNEQAEQMKEQVSLNYEIKQIDADIASLRREANDKTKSAAEREAARAAYADKVNEKYDKRRDLAERMAKTQENLNNLASDTLEDTQKLYDLKGKVLELDAARENDLKAVDKLESNIASSASAAASAMKKQREEIQKMAEVQTKWSGMSSALSGLSGVSAPEFSGVSAPSMTILPKVDTDYWKQVINAQLGDITIGIGFQANTDSIKDITNEVNSLLESSIMRTSEIMGNLIGTLASGGNAWGDFKNAAVSALGDMAIAIGKIAIKSGVAMLGIQAALKLDNPYVAIAAGAALVALGSAVKSSLSAVASGDYSAGGGGYSGSYSSGSSGGNWETRDVNVNVTGTFTASGDQLITVFNNTNKKNYYTQ